MLPRTASRTLRPVTSKAIAKPCRVCTCRCGALYQNNSQLPAQKRWKSTLTGRRSPKTWNKIDRLEGYALSPRQSRLKREYEQYDAMWLWQKVAELQKNEFWDVSPDHAAEFMKRFVALASASSRTNHVDLEKFKALRDEMFLEDEEVMVLARFALRARKEEYKLLGKRLLFTLSNIGYDEATMRILSHALEAEKTRKHTLRSSEIVYARGHLREVARAGTNFRAMVLEGKIAYQLGDIDYAIRMFNQAMAPAIEAADAEADARTRRRQASPMKKLFENDFVEFSSPWIELTLIHYEKYGALVARQQYGAAQAEKEKARAAIEVGCAQDDPTSHYHAALVLADVNAEGQVIHTSSWLYNMTKAAASGHAVAAHKLGEFYIESGWKYIEDEPPDYTKPTPFDSYPAPSQADSPSLITKIMRVFGLAKSPKPNPSDDLFHTAVFPSKPDHRWNLAVLWLQVAMSYNYAPSCLLAARMNLMDSFWSEAVVPRDALQLSEKRYTYASKADYEAGNPIPNPQEAPKPDIVKTTNKEHAHDFLRAVLYAVEAQRYLDQMLGRKHGGYSAVQDEDPYEKIDPSETPWQLMPWFQYPHVREQYEHEIWDLEKEAKQIADEQGMDIWEANACKLLGTSYLCVKLTLHDECYGLPSYYSGLMFSFRGIDALVKLL